MKLSLQRETLLKPLQMVIGVVERKQTLPILSNVLLNVKDNKLSITGTDLEIELIGESILDSKIPEPNRLTLPGRKLYDICKALPDNAPIELYQEKERIKLQSGRSRFTLSTLPASDFPNVEEQESHLSFDIPQHELLYLLQRTYFSMAHQDVRYYLNGMLFEFSAGTLRTVATDGHRLALNTIDAPIKQSHRLQILVPRKGVLELMRLLTDSNENVRITIGNNHIRVAHNAFTFTSKLIEGRFPDYNRVIPNNGDKEILIDRDLLQQALGRAAILCNEKFHGIRLEFRKNLLRILANNPEQEVAEDELSIQYSSNELDIGFNVNYLLDILNCLKPGNIKLTFTDSNNSTLIEESEKQRESLFVIMPMRL